MWREYAGAAGQRRVEAPRQLGSAVEESTAPPVPRVSAQSVLSRALAMTSPAVAVSHPADPDEQEAERVADTLSSGCPGCHESTPCSTCADASTVHRAAVLAGTEPGAAVGTPIGGRALDAGTRAWFEPRLGASLGGVRIHADGSAADAARHLGASAFTIGGHIGFGAGEYAPETAEGHRLLAHELAHIVQQRVQPGGALVQRKSSSTVHKAKAKVDLSSVEEYGGFSKVAVQYWHNNKDAMLTQLTAILLNEMDHLLIRNGVPRAGQTIGSALAGGPDAIAFFDPESWSITVDQFAVVRNPKADWTTKMSDLDVDFVAGLASACYHEIRHAEQSFLVARLAAQEAGGKKSAMEIAAELSIPEWVASAALAAFKATGPLSTEEQKKAQGWRALSSGGRHHDYWVWNEGFRQYICSFAAFDFWRKIGDKPHASIWLMWQDAIHPAIEKIQGKHGPKVDTKISSLTKIPHPNPVDENVLLHLTAIRDGMQKVFAADRELGNALRWANLTAAVASMSSWAMSGTQAKIYELEAILGDERAQSAAMVLWGKLLELCDTTVKAYLAYPEEADAYIIGGVVESDVRRRGASAPSGARPSKAP